MSLSHDAALDAIIGASTVSALSYQEAIEGYLKLRGVLLEDRALVWVVQVVTLDTSDFLVFGSEAAARAFAKARPEACVISTRVLDCPERYYERAQ